MLVTKSLNNLLYKCAVNSVVYFVGKIHTCFLPDAQILGELSSCSLDLSVFQSLFLYAIFVSDVLAQLVQSWSWCPNIAKLFSCLWLVAKCTCGMLLVWNIELVEMAVCEWLLMYQLLYLLVKWATFTAVKASHPIMTQGTIFVEQYISKFLS